MYTHTHTCIYKHAPAYTQTNLVPRPTLPKAPAPDPPSPRGGSPERLPDGQVPVHTDPHEGAQLGEPERRLKVSGQATDGVAIHPALDQGRIHAEGHHHHARDQVGHPQGHEVVHDHVLWACRRDGR